MIVAEKRQYNSTVSQEQHKPNTKPGKHVRRKNVYIRKRRALTRICVVLAVAILVISRFAVISEYNYDIGAMQRELEELQNANERLQLQHAQTMDINWIEEHALYQLGMVYPENRDIVYVAVQERSDEISNAVAENQDDPSSYSANGWFTVLVGKVNKVFNIK